LDNSTLSLAYHCLKSYEYEATLKPGQTYEANLPVLVAKETPTGKLRFKVGFKPNQEAIGANGKFYSPKLGETFWSEPQVVEIEN
jgi:hypothetical protein